MSHYEKLAIVIIRVLGCCTSIYALLGVAFAFVYQILFNDSSFWLYLAASITYLIVGLVLFALSKPLAALIARRL